MSSSSLHWIPVLSAGELRRELAHVLDDAVPELSAPAIERLWSTWPERGIDALWSTGGGDHTRAAAGDRARELGLEGTVVLVVARSAAREARVEGANGAASLERLARGEGLRRGDVHLVPFDDERLHALGFVGGADSVRALAARIRSLAGTSVPVLVGGESGTGKELVARALHRFGDRAREPWLALNCAELAEGMLESELFGHRRGAFTGALRDRPGLLVAARGGTVFLDEIGELSATAQAKLLRVLEEHRVRPVGAESGRAIDCRIVAATHRDLAAMADEGTFRADLLYRLRGGMIALPALRERPRDVVALANAFVARAAIRFGRNVHGLALDARIAITTHDWPGNVRELRQTIDAAVLGAAEASLRASDLAIPGRPPKRTAEPLVTVRALERAHLLRALEATDGKQGAAARLLGLSRQSLARRLRRHGLVPSATPLVLANRR